MCRVDAWEALAATSGPFELKIYNLLAIMQGDISVTGQADGALPTAQIVSARGAPRAIPLALPDTLEVDSGSSASWFDVRSVGHGVRPKGPEACSSLPNPPMRRRVAQRNPPGKSTRQGRLVTPRKALRASRAHLPRPTVPPYPSCDASVQP